MHCKTPEAILTHPSIHMKTTFADVEPNPAIVCVVGPAAVVTFPFNSRQAAVGGAVLAPGGGFLARAPCPSYNPNPNTSIEFPLGVSLAWYFVQWYETACILSIIYKRTKLPSSVQRSLKIFNINIKCSVHLPVKMLIMFMIILVDL